MDQGKHEPFDPEELTRKLNEYLAKQIRLRTRAKIGCPSIVGCSKVPIVEYV